MKPVNAQCAKIQVCEDEDYRQHLCRIEPQQAPEPMGLYRVDSLSHLLDYPVFVLAESFRGAISQATATGVDELDFVAYRVPFLVRGWGKNKF